VFIVSVKYSLKDLVGAYLDPNVGCHFDFRTWINGVLVDADPDGLTIGDASVVGVGPGSRYVRLFHPMPNPFTGLTQMAYAVTKDQDKVSIKIYDVAGRMVRALVDGPQAAGVYSVSWNGHDEQGTTLRPGMYFVQVRIGNEQQRVRVTFLK
jgi:flagellar hook capping protein FlgD